MKMRLWPSHHGYIWFYQWGVTLYLALYWIPVLALGEQHTSEAFFLRRISDTHWQAGIRNVIYLCGAYRARKKPLLDGVRHQEAPR